MGCSRGFLADRGMLGRVVGRLGLGRASAICRVKANGKRLAAGLTGVDGRMASVRLSDRLFGLSSRGLGLGAHIALVRRSVLRFRFPGGRECGVIKDVPCRLDARVVGGIIFRDRTSSVCLVITRKFCGNALSVRQALKLLLRARISVRRLLGLPTRYFRPGPGMGDILVGLAHRAASIPSGC